MWENLRAILYQNRRDVIMLGLLTIAAIVIFLPMMTRWQVMGDYEIHNRLALWFVNEPGEFFRNTPHFLYHVATGLMCSLPFINDINVAAAWTMTLCYIAMIVIMYWQLRQRSDLPATLSVVFVSGILALCLAIIMPINFFTPENLYFGYLVPHVYHNPTMNIMKPFALILFFMTLRLFFNAKPLSRYWIFPFAILTALTLVAKPNFVIAFVPTLGLLTFMLMLVRYQDTLPILKQPISILRAFFYKNLDSANDLPRMFQPSYINWAVLIAGIVLPTFLVLYIQTLTWTSSGGIGIEPFRVLFEWTLHYEENADKQILYKFIMSSAFPIVVYVFHLTKTYRNFMLNLAWLLFFVSAGFLYLIVDYTSIAAGDFGWSVQIAALILFLCTTIFMVKEYGVVLTGDSLSPSQWLILLLCIGIFVLHMVAGIHWYRMHMSQYIEELIYIWW